jgi:TRAP-type C4-dicarboxylate transport system permease small subunit
VNAFVRGVALLSQACGVVAAACLAAACLVVCQMVVLRYGLGASTIWQTEFVTYAVVASTLIGSPYVLLERGHVNVDLLPHYLGHNGRLILALLASFLGLTFCLVLGWAGWQYFHEAWVEKWTTPTVWAPPLWIVLLPFPIGIGLLSLQYVADIACLITGHSLPFGMPSHPEELE